MSGLIANSMAQALRGGMMIIGVPIAVACLLQWIGQKIRSRGGDFTSAVGLRFTNAYWYFVAPGVVCHETGHAVGALMTGNKVIEFVPFSLDSSEHPELIGWVRHTVGHGVWGKISQLIIASGPIWFGSIVILLLTRLLIGREICVSYEDFFTCGEMPDVLSYFMACLRGAFSLCCEVVVGALFSGWKTIVWMYLVFCVALEIGMSGIDLKKAKAGLLLILGIVLVLVALPFVGKWVVEGTTRLLPKLFLVHVLMMFAAFINMGFLILEKIIVRIL